MNRRVEQEIGENIIEKHGHKWKLIPRLRRALLLQEEKRKKVNDICGRLGLNPEIR